MPGGFANPGPDCRWITALPISDGGRHPIGTQVAGILSYLSGRFHVRSTVMNGENQSPSILMLVAVAILSAAAIGYEILLTRLFAIVQWHHFAFMVISIALLGFGASGTFLLVLGDRIRLRAEPFLALTAFAFALAAPSCFAIAQRVPFNVLEFPWSLRPFGWLLLVELLVAVPFFLAATGIGRMLIVFGGQLSRVYAADLLGAGAGAIAAVYLLTWLPAERTLDGLGAMAALASGLAAVSARGRIRPAFLSLAVIALAGLVFGAGPNELRISPFKPLPQALRVTGAVPAEVRSGPLGQVVAVENDEVPLRWAPGLSLLARGRVPEQVALFVDADGPIAVPRHETGAAPPPYLDELTSALPYHLLDRPSVLVLGSGGGAAVLQALGGGARAVDAVEFQPHVVAMVRDRYRDFAGRTYEHPTVNLHVGDPRAFVEAAARQAYDLIQVDALGASPSGLHALMEERLLTSESLRAMLARLSPRGLVAVTGWSQLPPRGGPRLLATFLEAFGSEGIVHAEEHFAWIRSWNTTTLVASRSPLSGTRIAAARSFADARAFDLIHVPGMDAKEANRFNVVDGSWFHAAASRLFEPERSSFIHDYKFDIRPATDDRPYFWNFFKWAHAPEILALSRQGGIGLVAIGYLALPVTLVQAVFVSVILILLPLLAVRRTERAGGVRRGTALAGFTCLGLAFLLMEIAFISRFTVILSHPLHALVVVLAAFLAFAGIGSWLAGRLGDATPVARPVAGIVVIAAAYIAAFPQITDWLLGASPSLKIVAAVALVAPIATLMGMPFPLTLARLRRLDPRLVPWAWGTNGCASVIGAILATLLAIQFGQSFVIGCAAVLYVLASLSVARMEKKHREPA